MLLVLNNWVVGESNAWKDAYLLNALQQEVEIDLGGPLSAELPEGVLIAFLG